jgi:hypothetical protein
VISRRKTWHETGQATYLVFLHLFEGKKREGRQVLLALAMKLLTDAKHQLVRPTMPGGATAEK